MRVVVGHRDHGAVSWLCDLDRHGRCTGVVAGNRGDDVVLRYCGCRNPDCTCDERADLEGARRTVLARAGLLRSP